MFNFELAKQDSESLLTEFGQNGCEFDYVKFLNRFKLGVEKKKEDILNPVIREIIVKLRRQDSTKTDLSNLKNLFKKFDSGKKGYLDQLEFRALLDSLKIDANSNDMYLISSQFDPDLKGSFRYELFLKSFIDSSII